VAAQRSALPPAIVGGKLGKAATQQLEAHAGKSRFVFCWFFISTDFLTDFAACLQTNLVLCTR
jgi:hypothetical protein